jgi:predicted site-specific integrase-resolvase
MSQFVDARAVAQRFGVKPAAVLAWARRGWIPCIRAGQRPVLFDVNEVELALRERGGFRRRRGPDDEPGI